jgi:hypothetical protein
MKKLIVALVLGPPLTFAVPAFADYRLVLKNGRQITVQSYREEAGMIKFSGLGGEIGIAKDQIEAIETISGGSGTGLVLPSERVPPVARTEPTLKPNLGPQPLKTREPSTEERLAEERAKEEKAYQAKLVAVTEEIKRVRDEYTRAARGNTGPEPYLFTTDEAFRRHQEDLLSRLRDAQNNPGLAQDLGPVNLITSGPDGGVPTVTQFRPQAPIGPAQIAPPQAYTPQEKALSDMRQRLIELQKERQGLINEMKQKKFDIGSAFLE